MVLVLVRIHIRAAKRWEFLQKTEQLMNKLKETKGCLGCELYQDYENENIFCFIQEWESLRLSEEYLKSKDFGALFGTTKRLSESIEIKFDIIKGNTTTVNSIRGKG